MSSKIAMALVAAVVLTGTALSSANAGVTYQGGPKSLSTVSADRGAPNHGWHHSGW